MSARRTQIFPARNDASNHSKTSSENTLSKPASGS